MRPMQKHNRNRGKNNGARPQKTLGNVVNRVFDSAGPEGKVRGTPQQIIDKYEQLARDAQTSSDRVMAENFLQHAEHYLRMLSAAQAEQQAAQAAQQPRQGGGQPQGEAGGQQGGGQQGGGQQGGPQGGQPRREDRREDRRDDRREDDRQPWRGDDSRPDNRPAGGLQTIDPEDAVADPRDAGGPDAAPQPTDPQPAAGAPAQPGDKPLRPARRRRARRVPPAGEGGEAGGDPAPERGSEAAAG